MGGQFGLSNRRAAAKSCLSSGLSDRRAVVVVWVAFSMVLLLGVTALALDAGYLYVLRNRLQATADASALAGASQLPDGALALAAALDYTDKNMSTENHGTVLVASDVVLGTWWEFGRIFIAGGVPTNAVQVTTRKAAANGNPVNLFFAPVLGHDQMDVSATAIAVFSQGGSNGGGRFLLDDEVIDVDIPVIQDMAADLGITPDELLGDANDDWFVDFWDYCHTLPGDGCVLELPTGQFGDEGVFDTAHFEFPFNEYSEPTFMDFLNWNEDSNSWRYDVLGPDPAALLDPLVGVTPVDDPSQYLSYVDPDFVHVSPLFKSDTSALNWVPGPDGTDIPAINALGWRRGLVHFKIIGVGEDPDGPGSVLPNLIFEFVDSSPYMGCFDGDPVTPCDNPVQSFPAALGAGRAGIRLVS